MFWKTNPFLGADSNLATGKGGEIQEIKGGCTYAKNQQRGSLFKPLNENILREKRAKRTKEAFQDGRGQKLYMGGKGLERGRTIWSKKA